MKNYSIDIGEVIAYLGIGLFFLMLILAIVHIYNKSKYKK
ncbi:cbb3-type cytochrome oxidase subunit 3 [Lelliottia amnigena]|nr:cbb3-type cytochrome oxidase subunit 3 [Lelliottia amnigena]